MCREKKAYFYRWATVVAPFFIIISTFLAATAQERHYFASQYTSKDGLPQNSILSADFDKNGFLWLCTQDGLSRFDGRYFTTHDMLDIRGLTTNRFTCIKKRRNGEIMIRDENNVFYKLSGINGVARDSATYKKRENLLINNQDFFDCSPLVGLAGWPFTGLPGKPFPLLLLYDKYIPNENECYIGVRGKLFYMNNKRAMIKEMPITGQNASFIKYSFVVGNTLIYFGHGRPRFFRTGDEIAPVELPQDLILLMKEFAKGAGRSFISNNETFVAVGKKLYLLEWKGGKIVIDKIDGINGIDITATAVNTVIKQQSTGIIIIGTNYNGLYMLSPTSVNTMRMASTPLSPNQAFYDVITLGNGNFLNNSQVFNIYTKERKLLPAIPNQWIFRCSDGTILCHSKKNISRIDEKELTIQPLHPISDLQYITYAEDFSHTTWTSFDSALYTFENGRFNKVADLKRMIYSMFWYDATTLWLVARDGIFRYDAQAKRLDENTIFADNRSVRNIYRARDGSIWLGTYGRGFFKYQRGRFVPLALDTKGYLKNAHSFYEDDNGFFWIPTNNGLMQCLKSDLDSFINNGLLVPYYYRYDYRDGMATNEFNGSGASPYALDDSGTIVYPSMSGAVYFRPAVMRPDTSASNIFVEAVLVDSNRIADENLTAVLVKPHFSQLTIKLSYAFFGSAENVVLEYRIEGLDNKWARLWDTRTLVINRLPRGEYNVVIRKRNGFGTNNYKYASLHIDVMPNFYETWWFRILVVVAISIIAMSISAMKNRALAKNSKNLEREVCLRTRELTDTVAQLNLAMDDLSRSEQELSNANDVKEKAIAIILHDIKVPAQYLSIAAVSLRNSLTIRTREESLEYAGQVAESAQGLTNLIEELLQWLLSQRKTFVPKLSEVYVTDLFLEIIGVYDQIAKWQGATVAITPYNDKTAYLYTDRNILKLIVRNLVDNALKSIEGNGAVLLSAYYDPTGYLYIVIQDSGHGMDDLKIESLQSAIPNANISKGSGLGFELVANFLALLNVKMKIESKLGTGTKVTLIFPPKKTANI